MSLSKIEILGYRGFKEKASLNLAQPNGQPGSGLTVLTGPNNSGKSSILECLRTRSGYQTVSFTAGTRNSSIELVEIKFYIDDREETVRSVAKGSSETERQNVDQSFQIFVLPSRRAFNPYFGRHSLSRQEYLNNSTLPAQRSSVLSNFEQRLFNILKSPEAFNKLLAEALGFDASWTIDQADHGQYFLKFFNGTHAHSSDGMGEGIVSVFSIVDSLYDSSPGNVVVIDEPELSLHPSLQKRVKNILLRYSRDRQIVISTHSPYFVDIAALGAGAHLARITTSPIGTKIHQLSPESKNIIQRLAIDNLYNPHVFGLDSRELFFLEDRIILTEGQEDVLLLPSIFDQLKIPLPGNFFGWGAGGANNIIHLCKILSDLGFTKVAAIFDGDKKQEAEICKKAYPEYYVACIPAEDIRYKKPRKATEEVEGLLDKNYTIKPDLIDEARRLANEIHFHMNSHELSGKS